MNGEHDPWWASGRSPEEGIDPDEDGFEAYDAARRARANGDGQNGSQDRSEGPPPPHWLTDFVEMLTRVASASTARMGGTPPRAAGAAPHPPDQVCDACPVCLGLRAVREVRPEAIAHLAEAARHVSLALKAFADAQARAVVGDEDYEHIDLDQE
jgi:hypothetical protein